MSPYVLFDTLADSVNPCLAVLALTVPFLPPLRHRRRMVVAYAIATAIGIIGIYAAAALDRELSIWERFAGDYSTHTAFAVSTVSSIVLWKRAWTKQLVAVLLGYLVLIPLMGYHSVGDVVTSALVALAATFPAHLLARRWVGNRLSGSSQNGS